MRSFVDTHLHLWDPAHLAYPWLDDVPGLNRPFLLDDYDEACGAARPDAMVFVECTGSMTDAASRAEVEWVESLAVNESRLKGIVAHASLEDGSGVAGHLSWLASRPLVRGVRRLIQSEPNPEFCLQAGFLSSLRSLPEYDLSFDICVYHNQLGAVIRMVDACPEVSFVLDHAGKPGIRGGDLNRWKADLSQLARRSNVMCKMSGLVTEADFENWTQEQILDAMIHALEAFGPERLMFGSDWPVVNLAASFGQWMELMDQFEGQLDARERHAIYCGNAIRTYRLNMGISV